MRCTKPFRRLCKASLSPRQRQGKLCPHQLLASSFTFAFPPSSESTRPSINPNPRIFLKDEEAILSERIISNLPGEHQTTILFPILSWNYTKINSTSNLRFLHTIVAKLGMSWMRKVVQIGHSFAVEVNNVTVIYFVYILIIDHYFLD